MDLKIKLSGIKSGKFKKKKNLLIIKVFYLVINLNCKYLKKVLIGIFFFLISVEEKMPFS